MPALSPAPEKGARSPHAVSLDILASVSVALAIFAFVWFVYPLALRSPDDTFPPGTPPQLRIEGVDALTTDPSGRLYRQLRADEMQRMTPGAKSVLVRPRLTVFPAAGPMWHFEAEAGEVSPDGKNIYLPGPVLGRRDAFEPLEIDGRDLRIMATNDYAESDRPATIRGTTFEARGTGMKIWLEEGRIDLLSDASGVMRPR